MLIRLFFAAAPGLMPALAGAAPLQSVALPLTLKQECGAARNEAPASYAGRPLAWCPYPGTQLMAGGDDIAALAGRRVYLHLDVDAPSKPFVQITVNATSFGPTGQVKSHLVTHYRIGRGRFAISAYVPADAGSFYWIVYSNEAPGTQAQLTIRTGGVQVSAETAQPGDMCRACRDYLDEALQRVRREFLFADRLPWPEMEASLRLAASGAREVGEMDSVMKELSRRLGDATAAAGMKPHGDFMTRAEFALLATPMPSAAPATTAAAPFETALIGARVGHVRLRSFLQHDDAAGKAYARALRQAIVALQRRGAARWIIDLREHDGGTLWPAIAALRPLLGNGAVGYFLDAAGQDHGAWVWGDPTLPPEVAGTYLSASDPGFDGTAMRTAVLIGPATSSSGEMLAIAFHGRAGTRSFGAPSAGYASAVATPLDRHGNRLGIVSKYAADRTGQRVHPHVAPDVAADAPLDAALQWLNGPP